MLRQLVHLARRLFVPIALVFLAVAAYGARDVLAGAVAQARPVPLLLTVFSWSLLQLLVPVTTWIVLAGVGTGISYTTALRIHVSRLPARYLPGGIWQTVSRIADLHALGVGRAQLSVLVAMENLAPLATALALGGTFALAAGSDSLPAPAIVAIGLLLALCLPLAMRYFFATAPLPLGHYLLALANMIVFWTVAASAFVSYWSAFPDMPFGAGIPELAASYLLAWSAGFVAFFAPQGIGVFEAVAGLLLNGAMPLAGLAVIVAGFRAATMAGDTLAYITGLLVAWATSRRNRKH